MTDRPVVADRDPPVVVDKIDRDRDGVDDRREV